MMVELAAEHGVAAICQKPLAWEMDDAKAMVQAMADRGLPFMVHENFRFQHPMRRIKELLDAGAIGRPFFGRISFRTDFDVYSNQPWLVDNPRMIIIDVAVHLFDLARCFMGEPEALFTEAIRVNPRIAGEDVATVLMRMADGTCIVDASYETRSDHPTYPQTFVVLEGTEGTITLGPDYHLQVVSRGVVTDEDLVIPPHELEFRALERHPGQRPHDPTALDPLPRPGARQRHPASTPSDFSTSPSAPTHPRDSGAQYHVGSLS